ACGDGLVFAGKKNKDCYDGKICCLGRCAKACDVLRAMNTQWAALNRSFHVFFQSKIFTAVSGSIFRGVLRNYEFGGTEAEFEKRRKSKLASVGSEKVREGDAKAKCEKVQERAMKTPRAMKTSMASFLLMSDWRLPECTEKHREAVKDGRRK
ncbi:unnamed protein product, partial [Gongylonema pulchrum]|uniref:PIPK domain-containing protein n=1 Tax=Gongylonema pulchrum TaxID=637853 RepID=A0A183ECB9_9BILA